MDKSFDPTIPGFIEGEVGQVTVSAPATFSAPALRKLVVDPAKPFAVGIEWEIYGDLVPLWLSALAPAWDVKVYAESIGPGPEIVIGTTTVPTSTMQPCTVHATKSNCRKYSATVNVPAGTLTEDGVASSGIYKLIATVFLNSTLGTPGFDLSGFTEGPVIRVENPQ